MSRSLSRFALLVTVCLVAVEGFTTPNSGNNFFDLRSGSVERTSSSSSTALNLWGRRRRKKQQQREEEEEDEPSESEILFDDFVEFLKAQQTKIIEDIEQGIEAESGAKFSRDVWGVFEEDNDNKDSEIKSGGITRVIQGGDVIEKGACSFTLIEDGILTADRAATIRARQTDGIRIKAGDYYSAAALSLVFHSRSPLVPTFRSDVRIFMVESEEESDEGEDAWAWFGGGADLTPYVLFPEDITSFHKVYKDLCDKYLNEDDTPEFSYASMKEACDDYFYLPARQEHRGTGGIFFDDMLVTRQTSDFVKGVALSWMPSWIPNIVEKRSKHEYTEKQKEWQLIRRGRYLEFNLLYDRGVKFGLMTANPRVEGVMVSAPPQIAYVYKHEVEPGSPEAELMKIVKEPIDWV